MENYISTRRTVPLHEPVQQEEATEDTAKNNDMQQVAGASSTLPEHAVPRPEEFTISVEQVREHFRKKGVHKSKDTVQRWCRTGELSCQKRGVLNRYFTTEASLKKFEAKILPDMIAETVGEVRPSETNAQQSVAAPEAARSDIPLHAPEDAAASTGVQENDTASIPLHAGSSEDRPRETANLASVTAENDGLREQLKSKESEIEFLREEVRAARDQRGAVVQISNRMLETLETIAIGGRLDRPRADDGGEPVRYQSQNPNQGRV